jgi:hypothetical protein
MSLKADFYDGLTGLNQKMNDAFDAGAAYVTTNNTVISNALKQAALEGKTKFTFNVSGTGTLNGTYLRANNGNNLLLKSFFAGIVDGLAAQDIYSYECTPSLNVSDSVLTSVDLLFNFQTA